MAWNPKYSTMFSDDGKVMGIILEEPYYPVALKTDDGALVFADITGDRSDPIAIPDGVDELEGQMLWSSPDFCFAVPVPSNGWLTIYAQPTDPDIKDGIKRILFISTPHSYAGGSSEPWKVRLSTVVRNKDLPFRRDDKGTWTAQGLLLEGSPEIPAGDSFEVYDLEEENIINIPGIET